MVCISETCEFLSTLGLYNCIFGEIFGILPVLTPHHQLQDFIQNNFHRRALALVMEMMRCLVLASTGAKLKIEKLFPNIDSLLLARLSLIYIVLFSGSQGNDPGSTSCRFEISQIFTQQPPAIRHILNP